MIYAMLLHELCEFNTFSHCGALCNVHRPTIGMVLASINAIVRARFGRGEDSTASDVGSDAPAHVVVAVDGQSGL